MLHHNHNHNKIHIWCFFSDVFDVSFLWQLSQRKKSVVAFDVSFLMCFTFNKVVNLKKGWDLREFLLRKTAHAKDLRWKDTIKKVIEHEFTWFIAFHLLWKKCKLNDAYNVLRLIFVRRNPDIGGFFLCIAGDCKTAASIKHIK